jgi:hypothetical protein
LIQKYFCNYSTINLCVLVERGIEKISGNSARIPLYVLTSVATKYTWEVLIMSLNNNNNNEYLVPQADLASLKLDVANSIGLGQQVGLSPVTPDNYETVIERHKDQETTELGISQQVQQVGWENISSRDCGKVGGRIGGHLGGQMVRELIQRAETLLIKQ